MNSVINSFYILYSLSNTFFIKMNPDYFGCTLIHKSNFNDKGNLYVGGIKSLDSIKKYKFGAIISVIDELEYKIPT